MEPSPSRASDNPSNERPTPTPAAQDMVAASGAPPSSAHESAVDAQGTPTVQGNAEEVQQEEGEERREEVDELMAVDREAQILTNEAVDPEEDEDGEDLFGAKMDNDYRPLAKFDSYEVDDAVENEEIEGMTLGARRHAEQQMSRRDRRDHAAGRLGQGAGQGLLNADDSESDEEGRVGAAMSRRQRRREAAMAAAGTPSPGGTFAAPGDRPGAGMDTWGSPAISLGAYGDGGHDDPFDLDTHAMGGRPVSAILKERNAKKEVFDRFCSFLRNFSDEKNDSLVYMDRIRTMAANNKQSLVVSFKHLSISEPTIGIWLADAPALILEIFNDAATSVTFSIFKEYKRIHSDIFVRISELPVSDNLRDIRHIHLNTLIKVSGVVTRRSAVFPHLRMVRLNCEKCRNVLTPTASASNRPERSIGACPDCGSRGPFTVNSEASMYGNFQKVNLQESPGSVPAGRLPRYKEIILLNDLIDSARPGDEVEVTGIYRHNVDPSANITHGFPVFSTVILANYVRKMDEARGELELTDDNVAEIRQLAKDPRIAERIFASIAPSIYGHSGIKKALALALFGGQAKDVGEKHHIRGDINLLMMGDPGTAKSQFLKYVEKTAHRAVYTTGKGASAVGLTAAVHRDPVTREWTLEGGALVLADRGVCMIDEFDKMNDADRTSIHEAMEQQSISISKAGIVTTLQARCSVIAAANPVKGRYDPSLSFFDNVDLTEPILSRFDVLCVVRDVVDATQDETLAKFVVDSHVRSHPQMDDDNVEDYFGDEKPETSIADLSADGVELLSQEMLRKYLLYAKTNVAPKLTNMDREKVSSLYIDLRRESMTSGGMPIALRHLESIVRLAEAHARLHLREHVRDDDINVAIAVMLESFFASQKYSLVRQLRRKFHKYISYRKDDNELLFYVLSGLVRDYAATQMVMRQGAGGKGSGGEVLKQVEVDMEDFEARAREMNVYSCGPFYESKVFEARKFKIDRARGKIVKTM